MADVDNRQKRRGSRQEHPSFAAWSRPTGLLDLKGLLEGGQAERIRRREV